MFDELIMRLTATNIFERYAVVKTDAKRAVGTRGEVCALRARRQMKPGQVHVARLFERQCQVILAHFGALVIVRVFNCDHVNHHFSLFVDEHDLQCADRTREFLRAERHPATRAAMPPPEA